MPESIKLSTVLPATPKQVYQAWLSGKEHSAFTGGKATVVAKVGGKHTAWDGYIEGKTLEMEPHKRIAQSWRTTEFPPGSPDSRLEVLLDEAKAGTKITLVHTNIPDGQSKSYRQGWKDHYFEPMKQYFASKGDKKSS